MHRYLPAILMFVALAQPACKGDLGSRQQAAMEGKRTEIRAEVDKVLDAWLAEMVNALPADVKKYPKVRSSLVDWRLESFKFDWRRPLTAAEARTRNLPFNAEFKAVVEFFDAMDRFWKKEIEFKDYLEAYNKLSAANQDKVIQHLADFDKTFLHVEAFYGAQDVDDGDMRAIYFFRHWQVAFKFPREKSEAVSEYLVRLCRDRLGAFCRDVPFESMHFAVERPYLQEVKRMTSEFVQKYPDSRLRRVFEPFLAAVDARIAHLPSFTEDPVMPTSISRSDYVGDIIVTVSSKGMDYENRNYLGFDKGWILPAADWAKFAKDMEPVQEKLEKERGPENMEILVVSMDREAAMDIPAQLVSVFRKHAARFIHFGGRRRMDGLDRRTVVGHLQFREVKVVDRRIEVDGAGRPLECRTLGQSDDTQDLPGKASIVALMDRESIRLGQFAGGRATGLRVADQAEAVRALSSGVGILAVMNDVTYERFLPVLEALSLRCDGPKCENVKALAPRIEVQVCGGKKQ